MTPGFWISIVAILGPYGSSCSADSCGLSALWLCTCWLCSAVSSSGVGAGGGLSSGAGGTFNFPAAANAANVAQSTVRTNAALNVAGRAVQVPVAMRLAANAPQIAARVALAIHTSWRVLGLLPWLLGSLLRTSPMTLPRVSNRLIRTMSLKSRTVISGTRLRPRLLP